VIDPPSSTQFLQYKVILQHVGDEALQLYLENRPTTVVNQSKFSHDCKKKYSFILAYVDAFIILLLFLVLMNPQELNPEKMLFQAIMM